MQVGAGVYAPAHVKASTAIETDEEYQVRLQAYYEKRRKAQQDSIKDYIARRVAVLTVELEGWSCIHERAREEAASV